MAWGVLVDDFVTDLAFEVLKGVQLLTDSFGVPTLPLSHPVGAVWFWFSLHKLLPPNSEPTLSYYQAL